MYIRVVLSTKMRFRRNETRGETLYSRLARHTSGWFELAQIAISGAPYPGHTDQLEEVLKGGRQRSNILARGLLRIEVTLGLRLSSYSLGI
jgi:hypothetical protein